MVEILETSIFVIIFIAVVPVILATAFLIFSLALEIINELEDE